MRTQVRWILVALLALAAPLGSTARAITSTTASSGQNNQVVTEFEFNDTVSCTAGTFPVQTFVSILSEQQTIRSGGQTTTTLFTNLFVGNFSPCGSFFEFKTFNNGTFSMAALNTASLTGHFVFDDGFFMDLNLTFTGTDSTTQGNTLNRVRFPGFMMLVRNNGSTRSASIGGSLSSNGHLVSASTFIDPDTTLSRNNSSEISLFRLN